MKKIQISLLIIMLFVLVGCEKQEETLDRSFVVDPALGSDLIDLGDILLEINETIEQELKFDQFLFNVTVQYIDGEYHLSYFNSISRTETSHNFYDESNLSCYLFEEELHCNYRHNIRNDYMKEVVFVTIDETLDYIDYVDLEEIELLNSEIWETDIFDGDYSIELNYWLLEDHTMNFDEVIFEYYYGLYGEEEYATSGEHFLDGLHFVTTIYSLDADQSIILIYPMNR